MIAIFSGLYMWYLEDGTTEQGKLGDCSIFQVMVFRLASKVRPIVQTDNQVFQVFSVQMFQFKFFFSLEESETEEKEIKDPYDPIPEGIFGCNIQAE